MIKNRHYYKLLVSNQEKELDVDSLRMERLQKVRSLSHFLDNSIKLPVINYRIGFDAIIGFVPVVGDAVSAGLSMYIIYQGHKLNIPKQAKVKMIYNVVIESVVGSIPIFGDIFDAAWKSNARNCRIIERHISTKLM